MVSPPRSGMLMAWRNAILGGSSIHVMSVCQPSASGGLSAVSVMYPSAFPVPTNRSTMGKSAGSPKRLASARCSSSSSGWSRKNSTP